MPTNMTREAWRMVNLLKAKVEGWKYGITPKELRIAIMEIAGASALTTQRYTDLMLELGILTKDGDGYQIHVEEADKYA